MVVQGSFIKGHKFPFLINSSVVEKQYFLKAADEQRETREWPSMEKNSKWVFINLDSRTTAAPVNST